MRNDSSVSPGKHLEDREGKKHQAYSKISSPRTHPQGRIGAGWARGGWSRGSEQVQVQAAAVMLLGGG